MVGFRPCLIRQCLLKGTELSVLDQDWLKKVTYALTMRADCRNLGQPAVEAVESAISSHPLILVWRFRLEAAKP